MKKAIRSFAVGILFSLGVIGTTYYFFDESEENISITEAKNTLTEEGYIVLTKEEYEELTLPQQVEEGEVKEEIKENEQKEQVETETETVDDEKNEVLLIKCKIEKGMTSEEIASLLKEEEIITDPDDFQRFLIKEGYSKKIQIGEYKLHNEMSYEEIAKTITKS